MLTGTIPDLSTCPSLTFYHVGAGEPWNRGFKNDLSLASDFDVGVNMERFYASNCQLSTEEVDKILNKFAAKAGTFTTPMLGSMVQKGKLALCALALDKQLNRVDLPTLGRPTIPAFIIYLCKKLCLESSVSSDSTRSVSGTQQSTGQTAAH